MRKKQIIHHVPIIKIPTDPARHLEQVFNIFYTHSIVPKAGTLAILLASWAFE